MVAVNLIGLMAVLLITLGFPGFYLKSYDRFSTSGFAGLLLAATGLILFTPIQYYETLIWLAAAQRIRNSCK